MAYSKRKALRESQLDKTQVKRAVPALMKYVSVKKGKQLRLLNEHEMISLILALKKIPNPDKKPRKIIIQRPNRGCVHVFLSPLPHSLHTDNVEVCLFSKEESSKVKEILKTKDVKSVKKVISLAKLRKNYQSFESKRQLSSLYDVFICDDRIYHLLPKLLGKVFFSKKKFPVPIKLKKTNLRGEIDNVLQCTLISLGHGPCSAIKVAHTGQTVEQAVENVIAAVSCIAKIVPRGWGNIQALNLKTTDSISLPIYNSLPEKALSSELPEPPKKKKKNMDTEKISEMEEES